VVRLRKDLFKGVVVGAAFSSIVLVSASAFAGTGIGAPFNLGRTNSVDVPSTLRGSMTGANLQLRNGGTGPGLGIIVAAGKAPITVNAGAGVAKHLKASFATASDHAVTAARASSPATLGAGRGETGTFGVGCVAAAAGDVCRAATTFAFPLPSAPVVHFVASGDTPPSQCPGTLADPQAQPGVLCVYEAHRTPSVASVGVFNPGDSAGTGGASPYGFGTVAVSDSPGSVGAWGTWAVTAPN